MHHGKALLSTALWLALLGISLLLGEGKLLQVGEFYSQSFVPDVLEVSYRVHRNVSLDYNATALQPLPGKLLFNVFVRRVGSGPDDKSRTMLKYNNLDFCNTIDLIKNLTRNSFQSDHQAQSTFITSCPLNSGFYYIVNGTLADSVVPAYFDGGWYWLQLELVQVFGEVVKVVNIKALCFYDKSEDS